MIRKNTDPNHPAARRGIGQRFFARMYAQLDGDPDFYEQAVREYKRWLFNDLSGTVVEIGAGTGANFAYYPAGIHWIGIEPNVFMHDVLLKMAQKHGIQGEIRIGTAERLELPDASADAVISTLVLCSVDHQETALREIYRVLKPGGRFAFVEHVAAPDRTPLRAAQTLIKPLWYLAADGCRTDRDTVSAIERIGFSHVETREFRAPLLIVSPHVAGMGIK